MTLSTSLIPLSLILTTSLDVKPVSASAFPTHDRFTKVTKRDDPAAIMWAIVLPLAIVMVLVAGYYGIRRWMRPRKLVFHARELEFRQRPLGPTRGPAVMNPIPVPAP